MQVQMQVRMRMQWVNEFKMEIELGEYMDWIDGGIDAG